MSVIDVGGLCFLELDEREIGIIPTCFQVVADDVVEFR